MIRMQQKFEVTITVEDVLHVCNKTVDEIRKFFENKPMEKDVREILVDGYGDDEGITIEVRPLTEISVTDTPDSGEQPEA